MMFTIYKDKYHTYQKEKANSKDDDIVYKKDNIDISFRKNEDDKEPSANEKEAYFKKLIRTEVSKIVDRQYDNILIMFGAGASVVTTSNGIDENYGKTVAMLANEIYLKFKSANKKSLEEICHDIKYLSNDLILTEDKGNIIVDSLEGSTSISNSKLPSFNLENFISQLETFISVNGDVEKEYKSYLNEIKDMIVEKVKYKYEIGRGPFNHSSILNIFNKHIKNGNKLCVVTTNYDTVIEDEASYMNYTVIDGFEFSRKPSFNDDLFDWNFVKRVPNLNTNELIYKDKVIDLFKIHGSVNWYLETDDKSNGIIVLEDSYHGKNDSRYPIMIFPSSNKYMKSYQDPYFELMSRFQEKLKLPNTLLVTIGFSFADNHISQMITQALKRNDSLSCLVTDHNIDHTKDNKNWTELENIMNKNGTVSFLGVDLNNQENNLVMYLDGEVNED
ncbi:SIR2 family protein [Limosilactobacillus albertensis]|uniref:SIR2 family protein n=1 Tax=Limosilactobacillus albertensis TaxID=2759752 RepID=A0A839HAW4_9LACO|nr:SIR2 family protein [Limosilactobacillus albertensis]MBB1124418.1 SIR2 family protein [Limosilactobacillus albertensis]MCD7123168.1 SIR2 family protein [Limosilactobacillus albertensis]